MLTSYDIKANITESHFLPKSNPGIVCRHTCRWPVHLKWLFRSSSIGTGTATQSMAIWEWRCTSRLFSFLNCISLSVCCVFVSYACYRVCAETNRQRVGLVSLLPLTLRFYNTAGHGGTGHVIPNRKSRSSRPTLATQWVQGHPRQLKILFCKTKPGAGEMV